MADREDPVASFTEGMNVFRNYSDDMLKRTIARWMVRHEQLTFPVVEAILREKTLQADVIIAGLHDNLVQETHNMEKQMESIRKTLVAYESFVARGKALSQ